MVCWIPVPACCTAACLPAFLPFFYSHLPGDITCGSWVVFCIPRWEVEEVYQAVMPATLTLPPQFMQHTMPNRRDGIPWPVEGRRMEEIFDSYQ